MKYYCFILIITQLSMCFALCPEGSYEWQNNCFLFESNATGFALATSNCISLGGELTSIHDGFTNAFIAQKAETLCHESTVADFWIGLTNLVSSKNWTWVDNSLFDFKNWASGQPQNITGNNCASVLLTNGFWNAEDCFKTKPYVCKLNEIDFNTSSTSTPSTTTTTTAASTTATTTTTTLIPTTDRPLVTPDLTCVSTTLNVYLTYFFDTGAGVSISDLLTLYTGILTETLSQPTAGTPTRWLSIYGANSNGTVNAPVPFSSTQILEVELYNLLNPPFTSSYTSTILEDLIYYQNTLAGQLTSMAPATPVIVMFLYNPVDNLSASIVKMIELKNANPTTYFMGVFLSAEPTLSQLPFDYVLNITPADNTAPDVTVLNIFNFICTVTPPSF